VTFNNVTHRTPIDIKQANQRVLDGEQMLSQLFVYFSPEEVATEAARRFRSMKSEKTMARNPPHCMIHAVEAACAYYSPFKYRPLNSEWFDELIRVLMGIDDPTAEALLEHQDFTSFMAFLHRSQLDMQRDLWSVPLGRAEMLFAEQSALPNVGTAFAQRFGLTPRQWIQMALVVYGATSVRPDQAGFDESYIANVDRNGIPLSAAHAFLSEVSKTPSEIGQMYRSLRPLNLPEPKPPPWTWYQHPTHLARWPLMRFPSCWRVPAPSLLIPLFNELLQERLVQVAIGDAREELSDRFTEYVARLFQHQVQGCRILDERALAGDGKVADLAIELPNAILVVEAKSVIFDRKMLTKEALKSGPSHEIVDGAIQVAETARRIVSDECPKAKLPTDKPIVGVIATLGAFPHGNADTLFESGQDDFEKRGLEGPTLTPALHCRPIVLGNEALESLSILLNARPDCLLGLVQEKASSDASSVGDWPQFLNRKLQDGGNPDLTLWRSACDRLLSDFQLP